jgi:hypothetical protein
VWTWIRHRRRGSNITVPALAASFVFLAVIAPWIWRCSRNYGRFVALRDNFGLEVLVGNSENDGSPANWSVLPANNISELKRLVQFGEPEYMAEKQQEAKELIERHPSRYALLTFRRILNTWTGAWRYPPGWNLGNSGLANVITYTLISLLAFVGMGTAIRNRQDGAQPLLFLVLVFPGIYYLTHSDLGFRHPIDPVIVIFLTYGVSSLLNKKPHGREKDKIYNLIGEPEQFWSLSEPSERRT